MKSTIVAALTLAMLGAQPAGTLAQAQETASEQADRRLAVALWHISVATHTRIGFQSVEAIDTIGRVFHDAPAGIPTTLDEALDAAIAVNPRYEWQRVGEVVVVRPTGAWSDASDPFNRPVHHFRAERTNESNVLHGIATLIQTGNYQEIPMSGTPVDFAVESGTLVDVLNKLAESADITFWQAGWQPNARGQRLSLSLSLVNDRFLRATIHRQASRSPRGGAN